VPHNGTTARQLSGEGRREGPRQAIDTTLHNNASSNPKAGPHVDAISMKCVRHAVQVKKVPTNERTPVIQSFPGAIPGGDEESVASEWNSIHSPQL